MEEFLPLKYEKLNTFLKIKAATELKEVDSRIPSEIDELINMIRRKEIQSSTDDRFLMWFLRSKKHDVQRSFEQVKKYSYQRHNLMTYHGFIFFEKIRIPIEHGVCGLLPKRDSEGRAIIFLRASQWRSSVCHADEILRAIQTLVHFAMEYPATQICGFTFVCDFAMASLDTVKLLIKYGTFIIPIIGAFPGRFQKVYIVNSNSVLRGFAQVLLSIAPQKLRERTAFYGDAKTVLPKLCDPSILPEEFGGTMGPLNSLYSTYMDKLEQYVPKLRATNKYYKRENTVEFPETDEIIVPTCK